MDNIKDLKSQYAYIATANLVLQSKPDRREPQVGTEVQSLREVFQGDTKAIASRFGDRVRHTKPQDQTLAAREFQKRTRDVYSLSSKTESDARRTTKRIQRDNSESVLTAEIGRGYTPLTEETRRAYEHLLNLLQRDLGHLPREALRAAAEEVIEVLRDASLSIQDKKVALESLLPRGTKLENDRLSSLYNVAQKITDFEVHKRDAAAAAVGQATSTNSKPDESLSTVPVLFDEEEEEEAAEDGDRSDLSDEGSDMDLDRYDASMTHVESGDESDEESDSDARRRGDRPEDEADAHDLEGVHGLRVEGGIRAKSVAVDGVNPDGTVDVRALDAFWLQRRVKSYYSDAEEAQTLANKAFDALADPKVDNRQLENKLVQWFDFDKFDLIRLLVKNRWAIAVATLYARASRDERPGLAERLKQHPDMAPIVRILTEDTADDKNLTGKTTAGSAGVAGSKPAASSANSIYWRAYQGTPEGRALADAAASITTTKPAVDLAALAFEEGGHIMSNETCELPENSETIEMKGYKEIHVPAAQPKPMGRDERLVPIDELPEWAQLAFPKMKSLNRIQSRIYDCALLSHKNMLVCAPTGAGKTNCAMLTIMQTIGLYRVPDATATNDKRVPEAPGLDLDAFKIVYIAPMKSLVHEMVLNFSNRLEPYGITVKELSGDSQLTRAQLANTQVIVTTPEKWDVVTRKEGDRSVAQNVKLIIIDEIHLLHDSRGPVLESIVARTLRQVEATQNHIRLVGLSATLPNYRDVAAFLRVDPSEGLFYFDSSYRPCPLHQQFIGVTTKNAFKRQELINQICYDKTVDHARENQVLIFVHSRKDTVATAKFLRDMAMEKDDLANFVKTDSARQEILRAEAANAQHPALQELLPFGIAFHHAGMTRDDRTLVEDLFAAQHIQVLVSTATLAWGVNLPAHTVIIKGTQVYSPEKGRWVELSPQDVTQMMGRAGRPQYDTYGEGIIITSFKELQFYLSLLNEQLPVESQYISKLADNLNAEVVAGTVHSLVEAAAWLGNTYLYVRMQQRPDLYGVPPEELESDPALVNYRTQLAHAAAVLLDKHRLVKYDRRAGTLIATDLGRVASYYYIGYNAISIYNDHLKPSMTDIELFRVFSLSPEFQYINVREEEKLEIAALKDKAPIPIKESIEDPICKVNVLLQAYLSRLQLDGFALVADMVYVTQSAGRLARALFEILLRRGWLQAALRALNLAKMIEHRMWSAQSPLRQFPQLDKNYIATLENKDFPWERLLDLDPYAIGELVRGDSKTGKRMYNCIHQIPRFELKGHVQPLTSSVLRVSLTLSPDFAWEPKVHGPAQSFYIVVADVDGEKSLHWEHFTLRQQYATEDHHLTFTVPLFDPLPPQYFVRVVSDRWLGPDAVLPISFRNLVLPAKFPPLTSLLDLQPKPVAEIPVPDRFREGLPALSGRAFQYLNAIQTQCFNAIWTKDDSVFVAAPTGSGKTLLAELAITKMLLKSEEEARNGEPNPEDEDESGKKGKKKGSKEHPVGPAAKAVYIVPRASLAKEVFLAWSATFGKALGYPVRMLQGDLTTDLQLLGEARILVCTHDQWEVLTRRWRSRKALHLISLVVADELQTIGGQLGPIYEIGISRLRYMAFTLEKHIRIVGLSASIANGRDVGEWIGAPASSIFAFHPNTRPVPLQISIQGLDMESFEARQLAMQRPLYLSILHQSPGDRVLVFAPTRRHCAESAEALITAATVYANEIRSARGEDVEKLKEAVRAARANQDSMTADEDVDEEDLLPPVFLRVSKEDITPHLRFVSAPLAELLSNGVGVFHEGMSVREREVVRRLFSVGAIQVCFVEYSLCYEVSANMCANLVVLQDVQTYDAHEHGYVDLPLADLSHMISRAIPPAAAALAGHRGAAGSGLKGRVVVFCHSPRVAYYHKFLYDPYPIESHLDRRLHDCFNSEVVSKRIDTIEAGVDYLTWTFYYRRLRQNANYYNMPGTSPTHVSVHLSELVENTLNDLATSKCIEIQGDEVAPLNLGRIAEHYNLQYTTVELFADALTERSRTADILAVLSTATEFDTLVVRPREDIALDRLARHLPLAIPDANFNESSTKVNVLLQAHFTNIPLTTLVQSDLQQILPLSYRLLCAMVDIVSSSRWLAAVLTCIEMCQMVTMGTWTNALQLCQVPHFTPELAKKCAEAGIKTVSDLLEMDDDDRNKLLNLPPAKMNDVARFCNAYPDVALSWKFVSDEDDEEEESSSASKPPKVRCNEVATLVVTMDRAPTDEEDEDDEFDPSVLTVVAPRYPAVKQESWWIVLGNPATNDVWGIKKFTPKSKVTQIKFDFIAPTEGRNDLRFFLMSDSWVGADQEHRLVIEVEPAGEE